MINCQKRDVTLSLELALDLAMQRLLIAFYRQQEVGPLLLELPKNIPRCGEQLLLLQEGFANGEGCAYRLDENALQINLAVQLPQHRPLMVFANGVAGLAVALRLLRSSWPAPGQLNTASPEQCRRSRPEAIRGSATGRGLNRAPQGLAITDQLVEIACPTWDLSNCPVPDCGAQGSHVNLPEEVTES